MKTTTIQHPFPFAAILSLILLSLLLLFVGKLRLQTLNNMIAYVRALSSGEWFGGWAPVEVELLWQNGHKALLRLLEEDLEEGDEYEFYKKGSILLCLQDDDAWKAVYGLSPDTCLEDIHPSMIILPG